MMMSPFILPVIVQPPMTSAEARDEEDGISMTRRATCSFQNFMLSP